VVQKIATKKNEEDYFAKNPYSSAPVRGSKISRKEAQEAQRKIILHQSILPKRFALVRGKKPFAREALALKMKY
jgi:hypothetical protein